MLLLAIIGNIKGIAFYVFYAIPITVCFYVYITMLWLLLIGSYTCKYFAVVLAAFAYFLT